MSLWNFTLLTFFFKGTTQNHALYKAVHSLGYSVLIYLSLITNTSHKLGYIIIVLIALKIE